MHPDARAILDQLALVPHPEGGFYRETFRSPREVPTAAGPRSASTAIYYLLPAGTFSALHVVTSDEAWHAYDGDPLALDLLFPDGRHERHVLGRDVAKGERPQLVVPAGVFQAATPMGDRFSLAGCTVAPGFDFADFSMPDRDTLLARFPAHRDLVLSRTRP